MTATEAADKVEKTDSDRSSEPEVTCEQVRKLAWHLTDVDGTPYVLYQRNTWHTLMSGTYSQNIYANKVLAECLADIDETVHYVIRPLTVMTLQGPQIVVKEATEKLTAAVYQIVQPEVTFKVGGPDEKRLARLDQRLNQLVNIRTKTEWVVRNSSKQLIKERFEMYLKMRAELEAEMAEDGVSAAQLELLVELYAESPDTHIADLLSAVQAIID